MKSKLKLIWLAAFGLALSPLAYADDHDIDVVDEDDTEYEYVARISPNDNADFGTAVSNMARDPDAAYQGREFGEWVSDLAAEQAGVSEEVRQDVNQDIQRNERAELGSENGRGRGRPEE